MLNNKIYVGVHKTKNLNDSYMGSGKVIKEAIEKYGIDNFRKDILETFENSESMYSREKEVVTDEFLLREETYNLRRGGFGGWDYINASEIDKFKGKKHKEESKKQMGHPGNSYKKGIPISEEQKAAISLKNSIALKGKPKSEEHKQKIREAILKRNSK
jgi:hypothetical protein